MNNHRQAPRLPEGESALSAMARADLRPVEGTRDAELSRLLELGADVVADRRHADGSGWVVLADPEGNEFCILRREAQVS
jgi:hypothetical protein